MTLPSPRLHPDPAPRMVTNFCRRATGDRDAPCTCGMCDRAPATDPAAATDDRGDWTLVLWVPVVFAVAVLRRVRWHVAGWLYAAADRVNTEAPIDRDALTARIMRAVEAEAARERGGAT